MKIKKSDWSLVQEASSKGLLVSMTSIVERIRTPLNNELNFYFRNQAPHFKHVFVEEEGEEILHSINAYLKEKQIMKPLIHYPLREGSNIYLIPIDEHIQLKILVVDEYYGDGEYSKYVDISFFIIDEKTTIKDVDKLIDTLKYLRILSVN